MTRAKLLVLLLLGVVIILLLRKARGAQPSDNERVSQVRRRVAPFLNEELKRVHLQGGAPVFIRTFKEEKELELWVRDAMGGRYVLFKKWNIANFGPGGPGPKLKEGDGMAPEGFYHVSARQLNPASDFHLSFNLGFPNAYDKAHGRTGTALMVHGSDVSVGCYAMTDPVIEVIYLMVDAALRGKRQDEVCVHCLPFRMTPERLAKAEADGSPWTGFWRNLKEGSDLFEKTKIPPLVGQKDGVYVFRRRDP
ncbi:MAG: 2-dehydro-3-deoxyphosphooctonate aldolase [Verrucomicrobiota bacterium]